ncbi:helix-turn-helix transcriptional regulator [Flavobacterium covae]|uniref:S24 family peptidase n=1 Tax=Flavobacterium covae TaxID=2906076 RepID=UPI0035E412D3
MNGDFLRKKIELSGFQLADVARSMNITPQNLQSKLKSKDIKVSFLEELAQSINKTVYYFFEIEEKTKDVNNVTNLNSNKNGNNFNTKQKVNEMLPNEVNEEPTVFRLRTDKTIEIQEVPLYNLEATAGIVSLFADSSMAEVIDTIKIPNLPKCDGALYVTGDSMYPLLKSGDIIMYKKINNIADNIFWGEMYLLSIDNDGDELLTCKYIQKSDRGEEYVRLVSQNQHHQDKDIHISRINALALIKASVRINAMY